eukprot:CAMPEP_0185811400 /NCGR_PEP_ID=MMETSP1322-20130828/7983_1 /TAXON_ID=265543 /ORGANISM="Minutocellus polymorphus, Strain RCC2270" /LENGTH=324 /DNA_ID=CAMNT_0028507835 /DNA_START=61 /DNA_END=1035 /DNA_ORIENTATION=+
MASSLSCQRVALISFLLAAAVSRSNAFLPSSLSRGTFTQSPAATRIAGRPKASSPDRQTTTGLRMGLDLVTYLRTEWISAALCTNQCPTSADVCLQLGTEDGRAVTFIPKTMRTLITSSAESDGKLTVTARRQLKQQADRRKAATIQYEDQRADDLTEVADESVDIVISLQACERMRDNGQEWKKSVQEAARVLKPGGRLLFVEATTIDGVKYLDYIQNLYTMRVGKDGEVIAEGDGEDENDIRYPVFDEVGSDGVDLVIVPHVAGVAIKAMDAGLSPAERVAKAAQEEKDRLADLSIAAFERGNKKRRKKKKKKTDEEAVESA